ncbi:homeobox protein 13-related [Anaeramoeba flamelloides]|uniref:Homeobox protein 13-related n=1 Tax=Anaeramoeba flamelloides TaxID=1746091 RepID=A0AAV7ZTC7_9EUKA|nr:homeobox protein 13-related [Anaeramoeba flamelloides]
MDFLTEYDSQLETSIEMFNLEGNLIDLGILESSFGDLNDFEGSLLTDPILELPNFEENHEDVFGFENKCFELFQEFGNSKTKPIANSESEQESKSMTSIRIKIKNEKNKGTEETKQIQNKEKEKEKATEEEEEEQEKEKKFKKATIDVTNQISLNVEQKSQILNNKIKVQKKIKKPVNQRKRRHTQRTRNKKNNKNKDNAYLIESGREVFKLLTGQLWAIAGGAPQKVIKPYSKKFAEQIGEIFCASTTEIEKFQDQLKYLLSNSRRTFTEFILEILIGVLSLSYLPNAPEISLKFNSILKQLNKSNFKNANNDNESNNSNSLNNNGISSNNNNNNHKTKELKLELEKIYSQIFSFQTLMYWFDKRFIDRLTFFFNKEDQEEFYNSHLFYIGKSKFVLSCLLLTKDLVDPNGPVSKYSECINLDFDNNPLNLYCNNRGNKFKIIKKLISDHNLNSGNYWNAISKDYVSKINFNENNICKHAPFNKIFQNPNLARCCKPNLSLNPKKKRTLANKEKITNIDINLDWLSKNRFL